MTTTLVHITNLIVAVFILFACIYTAVKVWKIYKIKKQKSASYYKLNILKEIINIELSLLLICIFIVTFCLVNKEDSSLDYFISIIINIACSIGATVLLSVIIYFKFLKHIPEETKTQIDSLLNERLGYETTNHNAVL